LIPKVFSLFSGLFSHHPHGHRVLHISGKNKTGKSMLIKDFLAYDLEVSQRCYFLIDTENKFALRNFRMDLPKRHQDRIFQTTLKSQDSLTKILDILLDPNFPVQARDVVIIDSLSEVLKNSITKAEDWYEYRYELQQFSSTLLSKLIDLLVKKDLSCIITHHVTYHPVYDALIPYYFDLINLIPGMWAYLEETPVKMEDGMIFSNYNLILSLTLQNSIGERTFQVQHFRESFPYQVREGKFTFINPSPQF
jgi:hypothetical protein